MAEQSSNTWNPGGGPEGVTGGTSSSPQTIGELRQKVADAADAQKNRAADGLGGIADVARNTSEDLRGQNETLASWVNAASDQLRQMADRLRDRPATELAEELTRFARERPAVFLGGAFLLGLGVARLLKSSPQRAWEGAYGASRYQPVGYPESGMRPTGEGRPGGAWTPSTGAY
jgi:hypothetical protein